MNKLTIHLTDEQRKQIKDTTGKDLKELHLDLTAKEQLCEQELGKVSGGARAQCR